MTKALVGFGVRTTCGAIDSGLLLITAPWLLAGCVGGAPNTMAPTDSAGPSSASDATVGPPAEGRGLAPEQIRLGVLAHSNEFQRCEETARERTPGFYGLIVVSFAVEPNGAVVDATPLFKEDGMVAPGNQSPQFTTVTDPEAIDCVVDVYRGLRFPRATKRTNAVFPILFQRS
jgi:hypothetical protein